jgi:hypothetical protein
VTSVAYPVEPQPPGWTHTSFALVVGWLLGWAASAVLYAAGGLTGALASPYGPHPGVLNEWPYADNGLWSLIANLAVILIVLLLTTTATSWWLRRKHDLVSDGRLAVVLFFTGWIPFVAAGPVGGIFGFLVAVVLIRYWVARHDGRLPIGDATVLVGVLGAVVLSYGLLHPLWTADVVLASPAARDRSVEMVVHNAAHVGVTIERLEAAPFSRPSPRPSRLHIAPRADGAFVLSMPRGGCGTAVLGIHARYRIFGLTLSQTLPARVPLGRRCY